MKRWRNFWRSFQVQVLLSYLPLLLVFGLWTRIYFSIDQERYSVNEKLQKLEKLESSFHENNSHLRSFLLTGYRNPAFYDKASEPHIDRFLSNQLQLQNTVRKLKFELDAKGLDIKSQVDSLSELNTRYIRSIEYLKSLMYDRGFGHYGTEGKLRLNGRLLEDSTGFALSDVLQLRQLEKNFLRSGHPEDAGRLSDLAASMRQKNEGRLPAADLARLETYQNSFARLVRLEQSIGINDLSGAYAQMRQAGKDLTHYYRSVVEQANQQATLLFRDLQLQLLVASLILLVAVIALSVYLSRNLTRDIRVLNRKVHSFLKSQFETYRYQNFRPRNTETGNLNHSFEQLILQLRHTLHGLEEEKQKAEKTAEYKSLFLANMSHEIRTPLNGVIGMLHMLQSTRLTQKQKQYMDVVEYSANHLLDLVNMILDHSKMDAKKLRLERIDFDLAGDMAKLIKIFEFKAQEKGLSIDLEVEGQFDYQVLGDSLRLQQVLINLLNNAVKFTNEGEVKLRVTHLGRSEDEIKVRFEVTDTGIGISADQCKRLFEAFEQLDGSTTRKYGGTGLGLAISYQLVELMGGTLQVESEEGVGSRFSFELPLGLSRKKIRPASGKAASKSGDGDQPRGFKVLLAEDNPVNQKVLSLMLQQNGGEVSIANDGAEALERFQKEDFDIILMDMQMPVMDGMEATRQIKKSSRYQQCPLPIIAVTANAFSEDRQNALAAGMDDFLTKPVRPQEFKGILAKYAPKLLAS